METKFGLVNVWLQGDWVTRSVALLLGVGPQRLLRVVEEARLRAAGIGPAVGAPVAFDPRLHRHLLLPVVDELDTPVASRRLADLAVLRVARRQHGNHARFRLAAMGLHVHQRALRQAQGVDVHPGGIARRGAHAVLRQSLNILLSEKEKRGVDLLSRLYPKVTFIDIAPDIGHYGYLNRFAARPLVVRGYGTALRVLAKAKERGVFDGGPADLVLN